MLIKTKRIAWISFGVFALSIAIQPIQLDFVRAFQTTMIEVDANKSVRKISPLIYGMAFCDEEMLLDLNISLNRYGGNATSHYNWKADATNRGMDWYFESLPNDNEAPQKLPHGSDTDRFFEANEKAKAKTMLTIPMTGYVAKDRERRASFSISKYGKQQDADFNWFADAGNGILMDGSKITNNNPLDAYIKVGPEFMTDWIKHLTGKYKTAAEGGVSFYLLDNEPGLWSETHRDVIRTPKTDDELIKTSIEYANAIKSVDNTAKIGGFEEWGYMSLKYSPSDLKNVFAGKLAEDMQKNQYSFFAQYYLAKMKEAEATYGRRLLDVFTAHYYPQGGDILKNTRSLWDPNYTDPSWINEKICMIPRMREWVDENYPGTQIGITEYSFDKMDMPEGGIAQADVLGIFGREGLDLATLWTTTPKDSPAYQAFLLYRNYDGLKSSFGDTSVSCIVPDADSVSSFASIDSKTGEMKIVVLNKNEKQSNVMVELKNFTGGSQAQIYQWAGKSKISKKPDLLVQNEKVSLDLPALSATIMILPKANDGVNNTPIPTSTIGKNANDVTPTSSDKLQYGDLNSDAVVDSNDLRMMKRYLMDAPSKNELNGRQADLDLDGAVDSTDYAILKRYILGILHKLPYGLK
jgi:hypothetical protein